MTRAVAGGVRHRRAGRPDHHPGAGQGVLGGDRPQGALKPLERTLLIQRQQSAEHGIIVSPPSDTSEIAGMMLRAVHFPPPGNTASGPTTGAPGCAPTARSASAATRHRVDPRRRAQDDPWPVVVHLPPGVIPPP